MFKILTTFVISLAFISAASAFNSVTVSQDVLNMWKAIAEKDHPKLRDAQIKFHKDYFGLTDAEAEAVELAYQELTETQSQIPATLSEKDTQKVLMPKLINYYSKLKEATNMPFDIRAAANAYPFNQ